MAEMQDCVFSGSLCHSVHQRFMLQHRTACRQVPHLNVVTAELRTACLGLLNSETSTTSFALLCFYPPLKDGIIINEDNSQYMLVGLSSDYLFLKKSLFLDIVKLLFLSTFFV